MNIKAVEIIEIVFLALAFGSGFVASQVWLYRFGYKRGYGNGKHCGFTEGLYQAKRRENMRLTSTNKVDKLTESWNRLKTKKHTYPVSSTR